MATAPFLGQRGTGDFTVTGQRPENWRETILQLFPNGEAPLTAMLAMAQSEKTTDPTFHWFTRKLSQRRASGTAGAFVYTNTDLSSAYADSADQAAGTSVYVKLAANEAKEYVAGSTVLMRDASDFSNDIRGRVTSVVINGASSYIGVNLLQADGTGNGDLSDCDTIIKLASAYGEGSGSPDGVQYDPTEYANNTQIFKTALELTRTAMQTKLRTGDFYMDQKMEAMRNHSIDLENALIFNGPRRTDTDSNGKPLRYTEGLLYWINSNIPANYASYALETDAAYAGKSWIQGGEDWINDKLEVLFRYGSSERYCLCGNEVLKGINRLAKIGGDFQLKPGETKYGIKIATWESPYGTINFKTHPRFNHEDTMRDAALFFDPANIKYRYIQDTMFKPDKQWRDGGHLKIDGVKEEWLTECGYEFHHPDTFMFLYNFNDDNNQ